MRSILAVVVVMAVAGVALSYAQQRIAADLRDAMALINNSNPDALHENYKEALNLVQFFLAKMVRNLT